VKVVCVSNVRYPLPLQISRRRQKPSPAHAAAASGISTEMIMRPVLNKSGYGYGL